MALSSNWYDMLDKKGKNTLRMETLGDMFNKLCKEIKTEFINARFNSKEKHREWQIKINNI